METSKMNPSSLQMQEDDWDFLSGPNSIAPENVTKDIEGILTVDEDKKRNGQETGEDWYTTIPPTDTPANTPEGNADPPSHQSEGLHREPSNSEVSQPINNGRKDGDLGEAESQLGEDKESSSETDYFEFTPVDSESEDRASTSILAALRDWVCRVAAYVVVFNVVRWLVIKVWAKLRLLRGVNAHK